MVIWKYPIQLSDVSMKSNLLIISMPVGARLLTAQVQREVPCIWALVDPTMNTEPRKFYIFGTGDETDHFPESTYIGTFQLERLGHVFHVFAE